MTQYRYQVLARLNSERYGWSVVYESNSQADVVLVTELVRSGEYDVPAPILRKTAHVHDRRDWQSIFGPFIPMKEATDDTVEHDPTP